MTKNIIVIGAGNAAFCAAMAAKQQGADVVMLEAAPEQEAGGNTRYTAGAIRCVYEGVEDLRMLMPDLTDQEVARTDFGSYTKDDFYDDMGRVTEYRTDPELCELLVTRSRSTIRWMKDCGIKFAPIWGRQAFQVDGKFTFWGGLTVEAWGGGPGLYEGWKEIAENAGVTIMFGTPALSLIKDDEGVKGVVAKIEGKTDRIDCDAVILATGGFQANTEMRTRYLGPGWDLAKVRGTRYSMGHGLNMALDAGAIPYGNWSGCHAVGWERNAPEFGELNIGDGFQKHSYPFGIMLNARGERFVDEGADFRNYTYAKYGREILAQPGHFAWQVFDQKVTHLLRDEYRIKEVTKITAGTLEQLAERLEDVDSAAALATLQDYNSAVDTNTPFNPNVKDGRGTKGLKLNKTNWANTLDKPPFEAYAITCGITFTFGGLRVTHHGEVLDTYLKPIKGLYAAGEILGGIFYNNYPGGSGLMAGAVFGKIAGENAGQQTIERA